MKMEELKIVLDGTDKAQVLDKNNLIIDEIDVQHSYNASYTKK